MKKNIDITGGSIIYYAVFVWSYLYYKEFSKLSLFYIPFLFIQKDRLFDFQTNSHFLLYHF